MDKKVMAEPPRTIPHEQVEPVKALALRTGVRAGALTVYGTEWCSWTKKQRDYLTGKGIPFTYVDCEKGKCPASINAFPTLDLDGKIQVGYKEI